MAKIDPKYLDVLKEQIQGDENIGDELKQDLAEVLSAYSKAISTKTLITTRQMYEKIKALPISGYKEVEFEAGDLEKVFKKREDGVHYIEDVVEEGEKKKVELEEIFSDIEEIYPIDLGSIGVTVDGVHPPRDDEIDDYRREINTELKILHNIYGENSEINTLLDIETYRVIKGIDNIREIEQSENLVKLEIPLSTMVAITTVFGMHNEIERSRLELDGPPF